MACKSESEISLFKGVATMLDPDTIFTLAYFVHTEAKMRDKSEYIYVGRIDKVNDLKAEIADMATDAKKLDYWKWKALSNYEFVSYDGNETNARGAKWLSMRIKKAVDWDTFCKILDGWKETKQAYSDNAKYASVDYVTEDGTVIPNLKEAKDTLLKLVGQSVSHKVVLKRQLV